MARWINVKDKFDWHHPGKNGKMTVYRAGEHYVAREIADLAIAQGKATEAKNGGKTSADEAPSTNKDDAGRVGSEDILSDDRGESGTSMDDAG